LGFVNKSWDWLNLLKHTDYIGKVIEPKKIQSYQIAGFAR
jgi:hypothetical protein